MKALLVCFKGLLMSFGGTVVDDQDSDQQAPNRSMLTGWIGNALGLQACDVEQHSSIQERLSYAFRCDREGVMIKDFQTADLRQPHMQGARLTSFGWSSARDNRHKTIIRERWYISDGLFHVALTLKPGDPSLEGVAHAIRYPARPLSIGRKCCLPSVPFFVALKEVPSLKAALEALPSEAKGKLRARWPLDEGSEGRVITVVEDRDWANSIHVGERRMREGFLEVSP